MGKNEDLEEINSKLEKLIEDLASIVARLEKIESILSQNPDHAEAIKG